jgi:hypothetical protein
LIFPKVFCIHFPGDGTSRLFPHFTHKLLVILGANLETGLNTKKTFWVSKNNFFRYSTEIFFFRTSQASGKKFSGLHFHFGFVYSSDFLGQLAQKTRDLISEASKKQKFFDITEKKQTHNTRKFLSNLIEVTNFQKNPDFLYQSNQ